MALLDVGDEVQTESGRIGRVVEVNDLNARVEFDDHKRSGWYGRNEHMVDFGVLNLIEPPRTASG